nr:MAG TPA: hypothetical protein [Caudoviricetes sp.]
MGRKPFLIKAERLYHLFLFNFCNQHLNWYQVK